MQVGLRIVTLRARIAFPFMMNSNDSFMMNSNEEQYWKNPLPATKSRSTWILNLLRELGSHDVNESRDKITGSTLRKLEAIGFRVVNYLCAIYRKISPRTKYKYL